MKRTLLAFAILACFTCLTSCNKNEAEKKSEEEIFQEGLIGLWESEQTQNLYGITASVTIGLYLDGHGSGYFSTSASTGGIQSQAQKQHFKYSVKDKVISYYSIEGPDGTAYDGTAYDEVTQLTDKKLEVIRTTVLPGGAPSGSTTIVYTKASL